MALLKRDFCLEKSSRSNRGQNAYVQGQNVTETSGADDIVNASPHIDRMFEKEDVQQDWLEIKQQGFVKTAKIFIVRYTAYIAHRIIRWVIQ